MTEFKIVKWYNANTVLWTGTAADMRAAVIAAVAAGANLRDANLRDANLRDADLRDANLRDADLRDADLRGADLRDADLRDANLRDANLRDADLRDADLRGADLRGADLGDADLVPFRDDIWAVLSSAPNEARGLLTALREGKIDGSCYDGACACLVGTIANLRGCSYEAVAGLKPDARRMAETWFMGINPGDTPETNERAKFAADWIGDWIARMEAAFSAPQVQAGA